MKVVVQCYRVYKVYIYIPINIYIHIIYIKYKYYVGNCFLCFVRFLYPPCGFHIVTCIGKLLQGPGYYFFMFFFFSATKDSRRWHITVIYIHIHKRAHCCKTIAAWCSFSTCDVPCICPASLPSPERENRSKPVRQSYSRVVWKARRCLSLGRFPLRAAKYWTVTPVQSCLCVARWYRAGCYAQAYCKMLAQCTDMSRLFVRTGIYFAFWKRSHLV